MICMNDIKMLENIAKSFEKSLKGFKSCTMTLSIMTLSIKG
jgi:hypothetical protein